MKQFAESRFWKITALLFIAALFYIGWSISQRVPNLGMSTAQAQEIIRLRALVDGDYVVVPNRDGDILYAYEFATDTAVNAPPRLVKVHKYKAPTD